MIDVLTYQSEEQKKEMEELITPENCGDKLRLIREISGLSQRDCAAILGTSESTIFRLETRKTLPTPDFMNRLRALVVIGYHKFSKLSAAEKKTISETLVSTGDVASGISGSIGSVSLAALGGGTVSGLSATGITSGMASIGGGSMVGGIAVIAAIPAAAGLAGYGLVKAIKAICEANNLNLQEVDGQYEIAPKQAKN